MCGLAEPQCNLMFWSVVQLLHFMREPALQPASASARAASYPMPPDAPVIIATLSFILNISMTLPDSFGVGAHS
jgi:hypothetical protein